MDLAILDRVFYHNTVRQWSVAVVVAIVTFLLLVLVRHTLVSRLGAIAKRTSTVVDDMFVALVSKTRSYFLAAVALAFGSRWLTFPTSTDDRVATAFALMLLVQCGEWGAAAVTYWSRGHVERRSAHADAASASTIRALGVAAKLLLWSVVFIMVLQRFGINVTALVTGLGIGGVALALAVQNILGDVFAALSIVFDKPFDVGDFIVVDQVQGTVEHIGLKTTRIRSISGEQVIISNGELLKNRIRNFKRMFERRVVFMTDVTYDTTPDVVARIPQMIREVVCAEQPVRFERSHVSAFTDSALRVETVYFVLDPDYTRYLDIQQRINLELLRRFRAAGIQFAFPTRTVHLQEEPAHRDAADGVAAEPAASPRP